MLVPNRHNASTDYRYGFNGKEKDDELKGEGNSLDFEARFLDPRIGRWFAPDPLTNKYPEVSPYAYCSNNPINITDPSGKEPEPDPRVFFWWRKMLIGTYAHLQLKALSPLFPVRNPGEKWNAEFPIPFSGRADLIHTDFGGNVSIWELKPSTWEHNPKLQGLAQSQINRYVQGVAADKMAKGETNFVVSTGTSNGGPKPFEGVITAPVTDGVMDYVASYYIPDPSTGMIYYTLSDGVLKPELQAAAEKVANAATVIVLTGIVAAGIVAALPSGGSSLQPAYMAACLLITVATVSAQESVPKPVMAPIIDQKNKGATEFKTENSEKKVKFSIPAVKDGGEAEETGEMGEN